MMAEYGVHAVLSQVATLLRSVIIPTGIGLAL